MAKRKKSEFGEFLVQEIKAAGMSQEEFYKAVGITKSYFYDLLKDAPPQPNLQKKMITILDNQTGKNPERRTRLLNLAAQGRNEIPADISELLRSNPDQWSTIRNSLSNWSISDQDK